MHNLFARFKKELAEKYPDGATHDDINKFCDGDPILRHPQVRMDFTKYILCAGE